MRDLMAMIPGGGVAPLVFISCLIVLLSLLKAVSAPPAPVAKPFLTKREAAMLRSWSRFCRCIVSMPRWRWERC